MSGKYNENASLNVAKNVPGFDIVLMGHDHARECKKVMNVAGDSVLIIDPASNGIVLSNVDVTLKLKDGKVQSKDIKGELTETEAYGISEDFMKRFAPQYETVQKFVSKKIGTFTESISTHPAFFGPSAFIDLIHTLQLDITGADISFAAPLSFDAEIKKGDVFVCQNEEELKESIKKITSPLIMIQHFVDKQNEMALEGYTINRGKDMQIITQMTWKYLIQGYYSPFHDVCMFTDKEMEHKLQAMFEEIGFEGVFEVEFLIDKDGTFYFMETNFRASAWNPTCKFAGMPLDYLWVKGMENGYIDPADRRVFEPFTSMSEVIDYDKRVEGGMVSIAEWLRDFKDAKCVYIYDKEDRAPWDAVIENWENFK